MPQRHLWQVSSLAVRKPPTPTLIAKLFYEDGRGHYPSAKIILRATGIFGALRQHLPLSPTGFINFHNATPTLNNDEGGFSLIIFVSPAPPSFWIQRQHPNPTVWECFSRSFVLHCDLVPLTPVMSSDLLIATKIAAMIAAKIAVEIAVEIAIKVVARATHTATTDCSDNRNDCRRRR